MEAKDTMTNWNHGPEAMRARLSTKDTHYWTDKGSAKVHIRRSKIVQSLHAMRDPRYPSPRREAATPRKKTTMRAKVTKILTLPLMLAPDATMKEKKRTILPKRTPLARSAVHNT